MTNCYFCHRPCAGATCEGDVKLMFPALQYGDVEYAHFECLEEAARVYLDRVKEPWAVQKSGVPV